jgi:hypothetical protein
LALVTDGVQELQKILTTSPVDQETAEDLVVDLHTLWMQYDRDLAIEIREGLPVKEIPAHSTLVSKARQLSCKIVVKVEKLFKTAVTAPAADIKPSIADLSTAGYYADARMLPLPELPVFTGKILEWRSFWDQFNAAVHSGPFSPCIKMGILFTKLDGEAMRLVKSYTIHDDNYETAIAYLKARYAKPSVVKKAYFSKLISLSPCVNLNTRELRNLLDELEVIIRGLQAVDGKFDNSDTLIVSILIYKLPYQLKLQWSDKEEAQRVKSEEDGTDVELGVEDYLTFLKRVVVVRESADENQLAFSSAGQSEQSAHSKSKSSFSGSKTKFSGAGTSSNSKAHPGRKSFAASALVATTSKGNPKSAKQKPQGKPIAKCLVCAGEHWSYRCDELLKLSVEERCKLVSDKKLCKVCFSKHSLSECQSTFVCRHCEGKHSNILCSKNSQKPKTTVVAVAPVSSGVGVHTKSHIILQTGLGYIESSDSRVLVRVLFDTGSEKTYVRQNVVDKLSLQAIGTEHFAISGFGGGSASASQQRNKYNITLAPRIGTTNVIIQAIAVDTICAPLHRRSFRKELTSWAHIKNLFLAEDFATVSKELHIDLIVGSDFYWTVVNRHKLPLIGKTGPAAVATSLGWVLHGKYEANDLYSSNEVSNCNLALAEIEIEDPSRDFDLTAFWDLEILGITDSSKSSVGLQGVEFVQNFTNSLVRGSDGKYTAKFVWDENKHCLLSDVQIAHKRLESLVTKLLKVPGLLEQYDTLIQDYVKAGYAMEVAVEDKDRGKPIHYLPHSVVIRQEKSTSKLRVVYDASSPHGSRGTSLNDCLKTCPNLLPDLAKILINFRTYPVVVVADIEKAFLQIRLDDADQDAVRFLWYKGKVTEDSVRTLPTLHLKHTVDLFGTSQGPFILTATLAHHFSGYAEKYPETVLSLQKNTYVDDGTGGGDTTQDGENFTRESCEILSAIGMNFRKFQSNDAPLRKILQCDDSTASVDLSRTAEDDPLQKVLGLRWYPLHDELRFDLTDLDQMIEAGVGTKRQFISFSAKFFDPTGLISPVMVPAKTLYQKLWEKNLGWDDPLPADVSKEIRVWINQLQHLSLLQFPRLVGAISTEILGIELHIFSDASQDALGLAAYLRIILKDGNVKCNLIMAKSRVAPKKVLTIPKLELTAATLATRLSLFLLDCHRVVPSKPTFFWTDATIVLFWIASESKKWKPYVSNRVEEIKKSVKPSQFGHCEGTDNPADLPSRGVSVKVLQKSKIWANGPEWLFDPDCIKPESSADLDVLQKSAASAEECVGKHTVSLLALPKIVHFLNPANYSSWRTLLRHTTIWVSFVCRCYMLYCVKVSTGELPEIWSIGNREKAENFWFRYAQQDSYPVEFDDLQEGRCIGNQSKLMKLRPYFDPVARLVKSRGRTAPGIHDLIILPAKHCVTRLIIFAAHFCTCHGGAAITLSKLRERFWVMKGRSEVRKVLNTCTVCRIYVCQKYFQKESPLPRWRITPSPPFTHTGVDFLGPVHVQMDSSTKRNPQVYKSYICLFTCGSTRALHLELCSDLSTEKFLLCLERFLGRRPHCRHIISDNAMSFKRADKLVYQMTQDPEITGFCYDHRIHWQFIPERSPWWGGFWERLVASVKSALKRVLRFRSLTFEQMSTFLVTVERVLNDRPISFTEGEDLDRPQALRPSDLLDGPPEPLAVEVITPGHSTPMLLGKDLQVRIQLNREFNQRWGDEYLIRMHSWSTKSRAQGRLPKVGDVVLIEGEHPNRLKWKIARVLAIYLGTDGTPRAALVKTDTFTTRRATQRLYYLESSYADESNSGNFIPGTIADGVGSAHQATDGLLERTATAATPPSTTAPGLEPTTPSSGSTGEENQTMHSVESEMTLTSDEAVTPPESPVPAAGHGTGSTEDGDQSAVGDTPQTRTGSRRKARPRYLDDYV